MAKILSSLWLSSSLLLYFFRQQKLEEALLFTGMFQDALQSLLDWLSAVEPSLSTETAVMGDPETVQILIDNHKVQKYFNIHV